MLQTLRIRNFAIAENVRVDFENGLNVITGETGAGKSILADALGLVLGERFDRSMIRSGEDTCGVEATFQLADPSDIDAILEELGLDPCDHGRLVVRRLVSASGNSRNFVNDGTTTVQVLKRLGGLLVDMHGPHDHQSLLSQAFQLDLLDSFGHLWKTRTAYETEYRRWCDLEEQRRQLDVDDRTLAQQTDLLSFQVKEIEEAKLENESEEALLEEHARVANAQQILDACREACGALTEGEGNAFDALVTVQQRVAGLTGFGEQFRGWLKEAETLAVQIQELSASVQAYAEGVEADPARLQWLDDRIAVVRRLKRKYGPGLPEVLQALAKAKEQLHDLETRGERVEKINREITEVRQRLEAAGVKLRGERERASRALAETITAELRDLGFAHGAFSIALEPAEATASGMDQIEFGFAPNVGEAMRPLRAIASSGEISRVMLATKAVLADHDRIPVLVFDEIDTNVGGTTANAVGAKLATVARNHQVVCITHLPQVAVCGKTQFVVRKDVREDRTFTTIERVEDASRVEEVARMLGGKDLTSVTLQHAAEMLRAAQR